MDKAKTFDEFTQLEECIVGKAYGAEYYDNFDKIRDLETKELLQQVASETEEDMLDLVKILEDCGTVVHRPELKFDMDFERYDNNKWRPRLDLFEFGWVFPTHPLMPRDTIGVYGETIVEFFTKTSSRYFENWCHKDIIQKYYEAGNKWISMPTPILKGTPTEPDNREYEDIDQILYHAANLLKCGNDIFYTGIRPTYGTGKGTEKGLNWTKRVLEDEGFDLHPIYAGGHADGKMAILRPGLVMCWDDAVLPEKMNGWDVIKVPDTSGQFNDIFKGIKKRRTHKEFVSKYMKDFIGYADETVFDVNLISVNENTIITTGYHKETVDTLKRYGIETIVWDSKYKAFWDGSAHCVCLDTKRAGGKEDYFK